MLLHQAPTSKDNRLPTFLVILSVCSLLLAISCDAVSGGISNKPNSSAPRASDDYDTFWQTCNERRSKIDDWERDEILKVEDEWIDGKRRMLQSAAKVERIEDEADDMRSELSDNCKAAGPTWEPPPWVLSIEQGHCVDGWGEKTLTAVKDAHGDVYRVVRLDTEVKDTAGPGFSSCGVPVRAKLEEDVRGMWAGHVYHYETREPIRASRGLREGFRFLEGWVRPPTTEP